MALAENREPGAAFPPGLASPGPPRAGQGRRRLQAFLTALSLTLVGMMLLVLPWLPDWDQNYFSGSSRGWYSVWMSPYFRGAVSGVGMLNLCVSFFEVHWLLWGGRRRASGARGKAKNTPRSG